MGSKKNKEKQKPLNGTIILPIENGSVKFDQLHCEGIELSDEQMLQLLAMAYGYCELKEKSKIVLKIDPKFDPTGAPTTEPNI